MSRRHSRTQSVHTASHRRRQFSEMFMFKQSVLSDGQRKCLQPYFISQLPRICEMHGNSEFSVFFFFCTGHVVLPPPSFYYIQFFFVFPQRFQSYPTVPYSPGHTGLRVFVCVSLAHLPFCAACSSILCGAVTLKFHPAVFVFISPVNSQR